jgi:hypothetical protein
MEKDILWYHKSKESQKGHINNKMDIRANDSDKREKMIL